MQSPAGSAPTETSNRKADEKFILNDIIRKTERWDFDLFFFSYSPLWLCLGREQLLAAMTRDLVFVFFNTWFRNNFLNYQYWFRVKVSFDIAQTCNALSIKMVQVGLLTFVKQSRRFRGFWNRFKPYIKLFFSRDFYTFIGRGCMRVVRTTLIVDVISSGLVG